MKTRGLTAIFVVGLSAIEASSQTVQLQRVMREKLEQSQGLLAALVTSDWVTLEQRSRALERLTNDPAWAVLKAPEFARYGSAFVEATRDLIEAARQRDQQGAPLAYVSLTLSCVRCHQVVAGRRLANSTATGDRN